MNGYNLTVSAASARTLTVLLYFAAKHGVVRLEPTGIWLAIGFALLYLAIPSQLLGTSLPNLLEELDSSALFVLYKIRRTP